MKCSLIAFLQYKLVTFIIPLNHGNAHKKIGLNMGQKLAKPDPPSDNVAKAEAELQMEGMTLAAQNFLNVIRLGTASDENLGYTLVGRKLIAQEIEMIGIEANNATAETIDEAIDAIFSGDWKAVTKIAAGALIQFLNCELTYCFVSVMIYQSFFSAAPTPTDQASLSEFKSSYLVYEFGTIMQYSVFIKKTISKSVGTLTENSEYASLVCLAKGIVDYAEVDPQLILFKVSESMASTGQDSSKFLTMMKTIAEELKAAAELTEIKKSLSAGLPLPSTQS